MVKKDKLEEIENQVKELYNKSDSLWMRDWFFKNHVKVVADYSKKIAKEAKVDQELCVLSALFHDIARAWGVRDEPKLMDESLKKAENLMRKAGYTNTQIEKVKAAIIPHSCEDKLPATQEGKVLATADALAHLMTDFYYMLGFNKWIEKAKDPEEYRNWVLKKIERDFNKKIFFASWKDHAKERYNAIKLFFQSTRVL